MKICYLSPGLDLVNGGGSHRSLNLLATEMVDRGHDVTVSVESATGVPNDAPYSIELRGKSRNYAQEIRRVIQFLRDSPPSTDIVHSFYPRYHYAAGYCNDSTNSPAYVGRLNSYSFCSNYSMMDGECHADCSIVKRMRHSPHSSGEMMKRMPVWAIDGYPGKRFLSKFDRLFALSPAVAKIYREFGVPEETISVVPNFVETSLSLESNEVSSKTFNILFVGRLVKSKGVQLLVEAINLLDVEADLSVDIVGDGSHLSELKAQVNQLNVEDRINFHGWAERNRLPAFYNRADVFVHPGLWPEPFGNTILEAMQFDTPVIVSDIGGPPWIAGEAGLAFDREDSKSLAIQLQKIITDPNLHTNLKNNCQIEINRFRPEKVVNNIENEYSRLR